MIKPLISCLCVTRNRVRLLKRAVSLFQAQTYPNRELLIVYESDDGRTRAHVEKMDTPGIFFLEVPAVPKLTLGELRNLAIEKCGGDYFCQWDDDDWHHPRRLEQQMRVIETSRMPASILLQWLVFDTASDRAYLSNRRPWEGSLLCRKSILAIHDIRYKDTAIAEDTQVIKLLFKNHLVFPMIFPTLYIYIYHGENVWDAEHWENIYSAGRQLSIQSSRLIKNILEGRYTHQEAADRLDRMTH